MKGTKSARGPQTVAITENPIAREMANRVQDAFEAGYGKLVEYEKGSNGISADTVFFHVMIYRSIEKNLAHIPGAPDLPEPTKEAATKHGKLVRTMANGKPVKLVDILTTFYEVKGKKCPLTQGGVGMLGPVCEF